MILRRLFEVADRALRTHLLLIALERFGSILIFLFHNDDTESCAILPPGGDSFVTRDNACRSHGRYRSIVMQTRQGVSTEPLLRRIKKAEMKECIP